MKLQNVVKYIHKNIFIKDFYKYSNTSMNYILCKIRLQKGETDEG